jgi:phage gp29-like protein
MIHAPEDGDIAAAKAEIAGDSGDTADVVDNQTDRLEREADQPVTAMIDAIKKIVDSAGSLEELRDGLLDAWPDMDSPEFADVMAEALAAAQMAGRFDLMEGI